MGNRTAKFISALVGSIIAGAPLAAVSQNAPNAQNAPEASSTANAAADCLASPKGAAPQGQHWRYRVERGTKRQCWYLRAEGAKVTPSAQAATDTPSADSAAPQSVQNARAEYIAPQTGLAASAPVAQQPPGATDNAQQPAVAARWPDASASPEPQPSPAPVVTAAAPPSAKPAKAPAPMALAAADSTADKPVGSPQLLLLVVGGALALAGILASLIYRFARPRVRVQAADRRVHWDDREPHHQDGSRAPWRNDATPAVMPRAQPPQPIDFDAARPQPARLVAIERKIDVIEPRKPTAIAEAAQADEAKEAEIAVFDREFEIEAAAPRLAASEPDHKTDEEQARHDEDAVDVDIITTMLERLLNEGPRLTPPSPKVGLANLARSQRGQSAARA
ncbi:hypothetical protein RAD15_03065 [Bradyrhizobium sp. 14AA]